MRRSLWNFSQLWSKLITKLGDWGTLPISFYFYFENRSETTVLFAVVQKTTWEIPTQDVTLSVPLILNVLHTWLVLDSSAKTLASVPAVLTLNVVSTNTTTKLSAAVQRDTLAIHSPSVVGRHQVFILKYCSVYCLLEKSIQSCTLLVFCFSWFVLPQSMWK